MSTTRATRRGNLARFWDARYRTQAQIMKSGARRRRSVAAGAPDCSELFEIAAIAHRHDDAFGRHDQPASILPLDLFDGTKTRQRRAGHDLINVAVSLHVNQTVASFADRPIGQDRQTWPRCVGGEFRSCGGWRRLRLRRNGTGDVRGFSIEPLADLGNLT